MAQDQSDTDDDTALELARSQRQLRRVVILGFCAVLLLGLVMAWLTRKQIAESILKNQLEELNLPARYTVESIGTGREVFTNVIIGDPARPDFTAEKVSVAIVPRWGMPGLGQITVSKPRLYGSYRDGKLSFGSLDKVLFTGDKKPFRLPDFDISIDDGRARIDSPIGPMGLKLQGAGRLRGGFKGELAAIAPGAEIAGCTTDSLSLYGNFSVTAEKPHFAGPLRLSGLTCAATAVRLDQAGMQLDTTFDPQFDGAQGKISLTTGRMAAQGAVLAKAMLNGSFVWRKQALTMNYALEGSQFAMSQLALGGLAAKGSLRSDTNFSRLEVDGDLTGKAVKPAGEWDGRLAQVQHSTEGTFAAPLLRQIRTALQSELPDSKLTGNFIYRQTGALTNLVLPQAALYGGSGQALLRLSRLQWTGGGGTAARISGNFTSGGPALPQLSGTLIRNPAGGFSARMAMADYAVDDARLALPAMELVRSSSGALGFAGSARLSGPLPGGRMQNLILPVKGNWSQDRGLALWRSCVPVSFDHMALANLSLQKQAITLCPAPGRAILALDKGVAQFAAGTNAMNLSGSLGSAPVRIVSGPVGLAWPGQLAAKDVTIDLGGGAAPSRFHMAQLSAQLGKDMAGKFSGSEVKLANVPLDVRGTQGNWRYANGALMLSEAAFRLEDRDIDDRFMPMIARGAELRLYNGSLTALANLREPSSDAVITKVAIEHNLASGTGSADLVFDSVTFNDQMQPDMLTHLAQGIIANANGTIYGKGRIDWTPRKVTSTGSLTTDSLNFAALFGPVKGLSGTITFTDLLGMVTLPDQRFKIASINPGIPAYNGELSFELRPGRILLLNGGKWPFLNGKMTLEPSLMQIGLPEVRHYTLRLDGLDAAQLVQQLDMQNISASGIFDGSLPLVFDQNGGRIENGRLIARAPGGNISYLGELTYANKGRMANFAFDALKSLNYRQMNIELSGALEGELITRLNFEGISQGKSAKRNFITRQIAKLPIRFNVDIRSDKFFALANDLRSFQDPTNLIKARAPELIEKIRQSQKKSPDFPALPVQPPVSGK